MGVLLLLGLAALAVVAVRLARREPSDVFHDPDLSPAQVAWRRVRARREARTSPSGGPLLPEGHRPPPGLGPLSPSDRFLREEAARGVRALQLWLLEQDGQTA